jgi:hypothetical protein
MDDSGNFDFGIADAIHNHVVANDKRPKVFAQVLSSFAEQGMCRQEDKLVKKHLNLAKSGGRTLFLNAGPWTDFCVRSEWYVICLVTLAFGLQT